jgi:hypothetical protein
VSAPPLSTTASRIADQAVARNGKLDAIRARQAELMAELERPSRMARELAELEDAERAAAYSFEVARQTIVAELRDARAEFEEARDASLALLPTFVEAMERAHAARTRLDSAQRKAKQEEFTPVPKLGLRDRRDLLQRWLRVARKGFDF